MVGTGHSRGVDTVGAGQRGTCGIGWRCRGGGGGRGGVVV